MFFGDGGSHTCSEDGVYAGSSSDGGIWLDYEDTIVSNSWIELSDTEYERLGVTLSTEYDPAQGCDDNGWETCRIKYDGVLEFWVR